jgi:hypothetical protein
MNNEDEKTDTNAKNEKKLLKTLQSEFVCAYFFEIINYVLMHMRVYACDMHYVFVKKLEFLYEK